LGGRCVSLAGRLSVAALRRWDGNKKLEHLIR
jgi:hypothetical protein